MPILLLLLLSFLLPTTAPIEKISLTSLEGKLAYIDLSKGKTATVVWFVSPECPLCESYSLTMRKLAAQYQSKGFQFIALVPGKEYSKEQVIAYRNKYQLKSFSFWFDPNLALTHQVKATITPEVFVWLPDGKKVYSGRIDNWAYELSRKRTVITEHDLQNVLEALLNKKSIIPYQTKAIGCFID